MVHGAQVWGPCWSPQPPLCGVLGTSCQSRQLQEEPTSPATPAVGGHTSDWSLEGHWELARDMGPRPYPADGLVLEPSVPNPESFFSERPKPGKNKKEFHGNISLGFSKIRSHPHAECSPPPHTPCSDAAPCSPSLATSPSKAISLLLSMWLAGADAAGRLARAPAALPPHPWSPTCKWGTGLQDSVMPGWPPQISNRAPEHLQDHSQRAWTGGDAAGDSGLSIDRVVRDLERGGRGFRLCGRMVA